MSKFRAALGLSVLLAATCVGAQRAQAGFRVCNLTSVGLNAAFGYEDPPRGWIAKGWWHIQPGVCRELISGPLRRRFFYLYANSMDGNVDLHFSGKTSFCISNGLFELYQSRYGRDSKAECAAAGLDHKRFFEVDTRNAPNHTVRLTNSNEQAAGGGPKLLPAPAPQPFLAPQPVVAPQPVPPPAFGGPKPMPVGVSGSTGCQRFPNLCY